APPAAAPAPAAAAAATGDRGGDAEPAPPAATTDAPGATADTDEPVQTKEQLAAALAAELTAVDNDSIAKKLSKLQATRRDLTSALKWADEEPDKRMKALKPADRLQLATQLVELAAQQETVADQQHALVEKLGVAEGTDEEIEAAFAKDTTAQAQRAKLEADYASFDAKAEKVLDRLSKPMFFDSPAYTAQQEQAYASLVAKGKKQFADGQTANEIGDKFTLATVFMTVSLFFLGLSPIMRRYPMKATFLAMGTVVATGSAIFMFMHPLA
ncbi:MAG: hypothetical protein H7287_08785, partial [Thermoleophilia bacterium]|nr:hypothetical protein [Thermoleophilia bacterium]